MEQQFFFHYSRNTQVNHRMFTCFPRVSQKTSYAQALEYWKWNLKMKIFQTSNEVSKYTCTLSSEISDEIRYIKKAHRSVCYSLFLNFGCIITISSSNRNNEAVFTVYIFVDFIIRPSKLISSSIKTIFVMVIIIYNRQLFIKCVQRNLYCIINFNHKHTSSAFGFRNIQQLSQV